MQSKLILLAALAQIAGADIPPLEQQEMQKILRTLQTQFAQPDAVGFEALNRAAITGLVRQNPNTIQMVTVPASAPAATPVKSELLTPRIACVRPGALGKEEIAVLREALVKFAAGESTAVILDLRAVAADSDPAVAADAASLFLPKNSAVSDTAKTATDPAWTREILILIDADTSNTGEVLAALLRFHNRAFLIGSTTRGRTAAVADLPVRKTDTGVLTLRYTTRRFAFPEGLADPFGKGLTPDMVTPLDAQTKAAVFALQAREGLARGVFQAARPRANEAALVAGINPEIPGRIARTIGRAEEAPLIDRPLQVAVDTLTAREVLTPK
jgi:hypothetical protein